jgi:uroporphyrinogen decarboxylase
MAAGGRVGGRTMAQMNKWERLEASIQQQPTDRIPWALWRHFYDEETSAAGLARAMLDWQTRNDFDMLKVNPRAQYHAEAWGNRYRYSGHPDVKPVLENAVVRSPGDWQRIEVLSPSTKAFDEQLQALAEIRRGLHGAVPFVETVFSPLMVAGYLAGDVKTLQQHIREHPRAVHLALQAIAETFISFVHEILNAGASGIFFATGAWATYDTLTDDEYTAFGRPYDLQVLAAAAEARINVLHVCRKNNMLRRVLDYPVHVLNWATDEEGNPSLGEIADTVKGRAVAGGLSTTALTALDSTEALRQAAEAADQARNRGLILAGNCSIAVNSSQATIDAVHRGLLHS